MEDIADWAGLLPELLKDITNRFQLVEDFMAFRGVCTSWRAAAPKNEFGKSGSLPLLMLAEKDGTNERDLYSISKRKICGTVSLPVLKDRRCLGARFGWLVTVANTGEMSLLNPISNAQMELPNFRTFPTYVDRFEPEYACIERVMLSANPSDDSSNYMLIVIVNRKLGFWRPGDESWKLVEAISHIRYPLFYNLGYCDGKFYAVDSKGCVWALDPSRFNDENGARIITKVHGDYIYCRSLYLIESSNKELILVTRNGSQPNRDYTYGTFHFDLIKIDVMKGEWEVMNSGLENDAVFIGFNSPFCVRTFSGDDVIKPNHIYFTDDCTKSHFIRQIRQRVGSEWEAGGRDMGVYNIQDQTIEHFNTIDSLSNTCPPMWIDSSILMEV